jgi:hypothetical protein
VREHGERRHEQDPSADPEQTARHPGGEAEGAQPCQIQRAHSTTRTAAETISVATNAAATARSEMRC